MIAKRRNAVQRAICICLVILPLPNAFAHEPTEAARWELTLLGVNNAEKLAELHDFTKQRRVTLGVVGQGGASEKHLAKLIELGNTITYHGCQDPGSSTHDTGQLSVILELTTALGVNVDLHVWQPGKPFQEVADQFREAAKICDVICLFQSFWGRDAALITTAIRESPTALFISPYVEHESRPTSNAPQGSACKPWVEDSIAHFVLAAPLSRRNLKAGILTPSDRGPTDSEAINFIAPSYHASGPGGTCPSCATTTACAVYLYATMPKEPAPAEIIDLLRTTSGIDRKLLSTVAGLDEAAIENLEKQIAALRAPAAGKQRKLDAPGLLNLLAAHRKAISQPSDAAGE